MKFTLALLLPIALCLSLSVEAKAPKQSTVHVTAGVATKTLASGGLRVPKVYVLSKAGVLLFETENDSGPDNKPLYAAINRRADKAGKPHPVTTLIPASIRALTRPGSVMIVSLESGASIGGCSSCENYYPEFERRLGMSTSEVQWVRIQVEKNDYAHK